MDYLKLLEHSFTVEKEMLECPPKTRFDFLAESIFDFTTYDQDISDLFGRKAVEVCEAINDGKTFEYQKVADGYQWYLIMCNMPFFSGKLEWGSSIRGAWWNLHGSETFEISSCGLWENNEQIRTPLKFNEDQWKAFISAMVVFASTVSKEVSMDDDFDETEPIEPDYYDYDDVPGNYIIYWRNQDDN